MAKPEGPTREPAREARRVLRKQRRHGERRRAILGAARQLLATRGIEGFTVSAVAAVAEVSKPAVYYYFESKEELVTALAADVLGEETLALRGAIEVAPSGVAALLAATRTYVAYHLADLEAFRILHVWAPALGLAVRLADTEGHRTRAALDDELARRLGPELRPGVEAAGLVRLARAAAHGLVCMASLDQSVATTPQLCEALCRLLARAAGAG